MNKAIKHLHKLKKIERKKQHPLIHFLHKKHKFSKKTLFYVKEYGPHSHVALTIIKESILILFFASIISSIGGLALEQTKILFVSLIPLIILIPILNTLIGDYGIIISSRFSTMLLEGKIKPNNLFKSPELKKLFFQIFLIAILVNLISSIMALIISIMANYNLTLISAAKIILISTLSVTMLVPILFIVSIIAGMYFYKKQEDPNNLLIPITTSIADFGNMILLALLISFLF